MRRHTELELQAMTEVTKPRRMNKFRCMVFRWFLIFFGEDLEIDLSGWAGVFDRWSCRITRMEALICR